MRPSAHRLFKPGRFNPLAIAAGLALGPAVALGLARFAYSLLLPGMRSDLHWSFTQAGTMNTANAIGYLIGALAAGPLIVWRGSRRPYLLAFAVTAMVLLASASTGNFAALLALRLGAGASGAVVFIAGAGLVARLVTDLSPGRSAAMLGTYFAGAGLGIVVSAVIVPPVAGLGDGGSWRWGWLALGVIGCAAFGFAAAAAERAPVPAVAPERGLLAWPVGRLAPTLVAYVFFGAGYIAYVTFIVAFLETAGESAGAVSAFWAILGTSSVVAAFLWGPLLGRLQGGRGPAAVLTVVTVGALLPLAAPGPFGFFASAVVFGGAFLSVPTAIINLARRSLTPTQIRPAIAVLTVAFSTGQSLGPVLAGALSDGPAGIRAGLDLSVVLLVAATLTALGQRATPARPGRAGHPLR